MTRPQPDAVSPAPLPKDADVPAPASIEETHQSEGARYRRRVILVLSGIVVTLLLYWASSYFFAYTNDAYVTSDFVNVAPYISGRIVSISVVDNQTVKKGDLLATIDPTPFQLALNVSRSTASCASASVFFACFSQGRCSAALAIDATAA